MAVSPKEPVFVTGSDDQTVRQWNLDPAHPTAHGRPLTGAHDELYSVAFTPDGSLLAAGVADGSVVLWNVSDGTLPAPLGSALVGHQAGVDLVAFSATGDLVASASEDMTVKLWRLTPERAHPSPLRPCATKMKWGQRRSVRTNHCLQQALRARSASGTWRTRVAPRPSENRWSLTTKRSFRWRSAEAATFLSAVMRAERFACGRSRTQSIQFPSAHPLKGMTTQSILSLAVPTGASSPLLAPAW